MNVSVLNCWLMLLAHIMASLTVLALTIAVQKMVCNIGKSTLVLNMRKPASIFSRNAYLKMKQNHFFRLLVSS